MIHEHRSSDERNPQIQERGEADQGAGTQGRGGAARHIKERGKHISYEVYIVYISEDGGKARP